MAINTFGALRKTRGSFYHLNRHPNILTLYLFIAFFVCRIHNCSISPKLLIVLAKTYGTQKIENHDKTIVTYKETKIIEGRYIRCSTSYIRNRRSIHTSLNELHTSLNDLHTLLNELHTSSKVDTYVAQRVTYVIEGRYIRRSTSYIRHRRSIHTPLNELHTPSKVVTYVAQRVTYVIEGRYKGLFFC